MAEFTKTKRGARCLQYGGYQYTLNRRIERIKEKLQSGDYSLDEYLSCVSKWMGSEADCYPTSFLVPCNWIMISVITLSIYAYLQVSGQLLASRQNGSRPNRSRANGTKFGVDQMGGNHNSHM